MPDATPGAELELAPTPAHQVVRAAPILSGSEIDQVFRLGEMFAMSGAFGKDCSVALAVTKILLGRTLGLNESQSMKAIHVFDGNIQLHYSALLGFLRSRDGYDYRITEETDEACTIEATDNNWATVRATVRTTMQMADREGWSKDSRGLKRNWKTQPRVMLLARAASILVREHFPEVTSGMAVYVEDEVALSTGGLSNTDRDGSAIGHTLPQAVERVIARARRLRYRPLSDRGVVELQVAGRDVEAVSAWVAQATAELDTVEEVDAATAAAAQEAVQDATGDVVDATVVKP